MQGYLNNDQIDYIFYHLNFFIDTEKIRPFIYFSKESTNNDASKQIIFNLSNKKIDAENIFSIKNIPILFPLNKEKPFYSFEKNKLIFNHDILKSAFFLLSGYQEITCTEKDSLGRFMHKNSIQKKYSFTTKPIVNYYFKIITEALLDFSKKNKIKFASKQVYKKPVFILSHDVDRIKTRYSSKIPFKIKQFFNLKPARLTKKQIFNNIIKYLLKFNQKIWSLNWLLELEITHNVRSVFFLLDNDSDKDSRYSLKEKKTIELINKLKKHKFNIGIHGTYNSYKNEKKLKKIKEDLQEISNVKTMGIRQHYLRCEVPRTQILQQKAGYLYDTTLGFAEHEGFRNSFCYPFKLYDFENDKTLDIWEIPLVIMDGSLFEYRGLELHQAKKTINNISAEIKKFNGILTILWHNDYFDEVQYKGITNLYKQILKDTLDNGFQNLLGTEAIKIIEKN
ncbi:MAG: polysaccharide deacetylase family protein [Bacteroidales bacterium]|nr:polysaccharide deacetylase family protein [Bacteroidales bacterium]